MNNKTNIKSYLLKILYYILISLYLFYILILIIFSNNFKITKSFINISESMTPIIPINSVVVVQERPSYEIGDIVSYYAKINNEVVIVTHRIKEVSGNVYVTKGDSNSLVDRELVKPRLIIGRVFLVIPSLGNVLIFSKTLMGLILSIILPAIMLSSIELKKIIWEPNYFKKEELENNQI